jgi:hypothetical protein
MYATEQEAIDWVDENPCTPYCRLDHRGLVENYVFRGDATALAFALRDGVGSVWMDWHSPAVAMVGCGGRSSAPIMVNSAMAAKLFAAIGRSGWRGSDVFAWPPVIEHAVALFRVGAALGE